MPGKKLLELEHISAGYNGRMVLKNVDFVVHEKDFIGIIGANGSGKTTLLKVILGLIRPLRGHVRFFFQDREQSENRRHIGYLPQVSRFDAQFPICVQDVVVSGLTCPAGSRSLCRRLTKEDKQKVNDLMERMGVLQLKKRPIGELSGGQMQRVFLARALISSPRLLLLDEPNTFVDKGFEVNFFEILDELNKEIAIVLVSHDLGMISSHVKSIACVNQGLYYHDSNEITQELLDNYGCPIDLITHGDLPHRVLRDHEHAYDSCDRCRGEKEKND